MAEPKLHYSASGYCTGCGEIIAEMDGIEFGDFQGNLIERSEHWFARHLAEMHS